ncbi:MAG TPA: hypothetical protein VER32_11340 [Pyrinomonadaceae bacterium]|nr:hypothetical protein [Pyrinomonadaceae bacterium]
MMTSLSTARFQKQRSCPSAESLLRYSREGAARGDGGPVAAHLAVCDFCGAEQQLLARAESCLCSAAAPTAAARVEMPPHLRRLAEDLLAQPSMKRARFVESVYELERLTLTTDACESIS